MDRTSYSQLTEAEQNAFHTLRDQWRIWALANIGANGDYWDGLEPRQQAGSWAIYYEGRPTPFSTPSRLVAAALIEYAQAGLSKL
ncbi:hypothetical protein ACFPOA_15785 [Lysobacter niabensis]|uniref:hypothetical protein n=1 Tax=Agrilutibacter niabensis TaxID=380628 RepID=UPI00361AC3EA